MLKTKEVMITAEGRDRGRNYLITEMPAAKAEKWAARMFLALARSGVDLPVTMLGSGIVSLAVMGVGALSSMTFEEAEYLLDEMMKCVQYRWNPGNLDLLRTPMEGDIEEVATILHLRMEIITLHTGFTLADVRSALDQAASAAQSTKNQPTSPD